MLVRFHSDVGGFLMFGDMAVELLKMAGHSGTVPGAWRADDLAEARTRLLAALERRPEAADPADAEDGDDGPPVGLRQRAMPLLELLERAASSESPVRWEQSTY